MAIFGIIFIVVALFLIGVGIAVGLVAIGVAGVLVGLGVLSSSLMIGLRTGRTDAGIRAFLLQCGVLMGVPSGAICAWLLQQFSEQIGEVWVVPFYGALAGAAAGLCLALAFDYIARHLHQLVAQRLRSAQASFTDRSNQTR